MNIVTILCLLICSVDLCGSDGNGGCSAGVIGKLPTMRMLLQTLITALYVLQDMLQWVECVLNHAAVLSMKTLALALHLLWLMKLDTSKNITTLHYIQFTKYFIFSLGMQHDGTNNVCVNSRRIMASSGNGQAENFLWSSCSASYLQSFLRYHLSVYKTLYVIYVYFLSP